MGNARQLTHLMYSRGLNHRAQCTAQAACMGMCMCMYMHTLHVQCHMCIPIRRRLRRRSSHACQSCWRAFVLRKFAIRARGLASRETTRIPPLTSMSKHQPHGPSIKRTGPCGVTDTVSCATGEALIPVGRRVRGLRAAKRLSPDFVGHAGCSRTTDARTQLLSSDSRVCLRCSFC